MAFRKTTYQEALRRPEKIVITPEEIEEQIRKDRIANLPRKEYMKTDEFKERYNERRRRDYQSNKPKPKPKKKSELHKPLDGGETNWDLVTVKPKTEEEYKRELEEYEQAPKKRGRKKIIRTPEEEEAYREHRRKLRRESYYRHKKPSKNPVGRPRKPIKKGPKPSPTPRERPKLSPEARKKRSEQIRRWWNSLTPEQKAEHTLKARKTREINKEKLPPEGKFKSFTNKPIRKGKPFPPNDHLGRYSLRNSKRDFQIHPEYIQEYYDFLYQHNKKYGLHRKMTYTIRELINEVSLNASKYETVKDDPDRLFDVAQIDPPHDVHFKVHFDEPDMVNIVIRREDWNDPSKLLDMPLKYRGKDAYKKMSKEELEKLGTIGINGPKGTEGPHGEDNKKDEEKIRVESNKKEIKKVSKTAKPRGRPRK